MSSFFSGGRYGGRAWLAPPPCAPLAARPSEPPAPAAPTYVVPAMAAWLARRHLVVNSIVYACWGSRSPSQAPIDHAAPAVNAPSSSCAYGQLLPRRRTEARVRGADHWPPVEHRAQDQHAAREALLGPRFRLICAACLRTRIVHPRRGSPYTGGCAPLVIKRRPHTPIMLTKQSLIPLPLGVCIETSIIFSPHNRFLCFKDSASPKCDQPLR